MARPRYFPVTVELPCAVPPAHAFAAIAPIDLRAIFTGWGPLPAVVGVDNQPPRWDRPGLARNPRFSDGGTVKERLTQYDPPHSFAYELTGFTNALGWLVTKVRGEWTMTPDGAGSMVRWSYGFYPLPGRFWLVRWVIAPMWRRYARRALAAAVRVAERG